MSENDVNNFQTEEILLEDTAKEPKLSFFQKMINVFINPVKVMEDIVIKPTMLVAILVMIVVFTLLNVARLDLLKEFTTQQMELALAKNPNSPQISDIPESMIMIQVYVTVAIISIMPLLVVIFKGLITHGITRLFDGKGKMKQSFSVMAFSYFIVMFGEIIRTIINILTQNYLVTFSLAAVVPSLEFNTPIYNLLSQFDVFAIWYLIVSVIGISIVHKISKGKAAVAIFAPWVLMVGYNVVMAVIRG